MVCLHWPIHVQPNIQSKQVYCNIKWINISIFKFFKWWNCVFFYIKYSIYSQTENYISLLAFGHWLIAISITPLIKNVINKLAFREKTNINYFTQKYTFFYFSTMRNMIDCVFFFFTFCSFMETFVRKRSLNKRIWKKLEL